jgi:outer membrane protein assembly factor BamB
LLYAFDAETGDVRWSYDIRQDGDQAYFHGELLFADDLVFVTTDGQGVGHVYAFERATGVPRWKYAAGHNVPSDVVRSGSTVYAVSQADELLALELATGEPRWKFSSRGDRAGRAKFVSSPAVLGSRVYFSGRDGFLYALDAASGEVAWTHDLGTVRPTWPVGWQGAVVVGTDDGRLLRFNAVTGEVEAQLELGEPVTVAYSLVPAPGGLLVPLGGRASSPVEWALVDPALESVVWRAGDDGHWSTLRPHVWNGAVVTGDGSGRVFVLELGDGSERVSFRVEGTVRSAGSEGDVLYVGTIEGMLYAFRMEGY